MKSVTLSYQMDLDSLFSPFLDESRGSPWFIQIGILISFPAKQGNFVWINWIATREGVSEGWLDSRETASIHLLFVCGVIEFLDAPKIMFMLKELHWESEMKIYK